MKKVLFSFLLFGTFLAYGQASVQFSDPQPSGVSSTSTTDESCFGKYKDANTGVTYVVSREGISIETVVISYVTREQIRESSKLQVKGSHLHGLNGNDSVPCVEEDDKVYYGIQQKLVVIGAGNLNSLSRISAKKYVINFHEGAYFEPSLLTFEGNKLVITHGELKYSHPFSKYLQVKTITRYGESVAILAPTYEQWEGLEKLLFTGERRSYIKE